MTDEIEAPLPRAGGPYSLIRRVSGPTVYVAGQIGADPATGALRPGGIGPETEQAIANVTAILATQGCSLKDVVKVSVFLVDIAEFGAMNEVYSRFFPQPFPARSTVQVGLGAGARVEIDAVAQVP
jgi:2-iminobutanoate/2-iminopropanoate deaminase